MSRITPQEIKNYSWFARILFFFQTKKYGSIPEPLLLWGRSPKVMRRFLSLWRALNRKESPLEPQLRALVCVKISQINQCAFCVDMNSALLLRKDNSSQQKLSELQDFETSLLFSKKEKTALNYAIAVTKSDTKVDEKTFQEMKKYFSDDEIVELTALIGFQNMSSKFNTALGAASFGFCQIKSL